MPRLMATLYDRCSAKTEEAGVVEWRRNLLGDLSGDVLEIGAGTGANVPWYPEAVTQLVLTEPDPHMRRRLKAKFADHQATVVDAGVDSLPFEDESFDAVVSTLVLCSVPDLAAALAEIQRVLRGGGRFVYLEHVAAVERPNRLKWQRRIEPVWKRLVGNCHLTRSTEIAIADAGFEVQEERRESMRKSPPWIRTTVRGYARAPS